MRATRSRARRHIAQRPVPVAAERPREELVPGAEPGQRGVDLHRHLHVGVDAVRPRVVRGHELRQGGVEARGGARTGVVPEQALAPRGELAGGSRRRGVDRRLDDGGAGQKLAAHVLAGLDPALELIAPGGEAIDPAAHGEDVAADLLDGEGAAVAVVSERAHGRLAEAALALAAVAHDRGHRVVAVGEHIRGHLHHVAGDPFDGEPAVVDPGADVLDDDPAPAVGVGDLGARKFAGGPRHGARTLLDRGEGSPRSGPAAGPGLTRKRAPGRSPSGGSLVSRGGGRPRR